MELCNVAKHRMARRETSNHYRAKGTSEVLCLSHGVNGKTMESGEEYFKLIMKIDWLAADLHRLA